MSQNNQPLKPEGPPSYERLRAYSIAIFRVGGSRGHLERTLLRSIREGTSSNDYLSKTTTGRCPSGAFAHTEFWSTSGPAHAATGAFFRPLCYTACSEGVVISDATSAKVKFPNRTNFPSRFRPGILGKRGIAKRRTSQRRQLKNSARARLNCAVPP